MVVKKDLIKNRNGFTFRRNWRNPPRCRVRHLHFLRGKLCGRARVHGHARMPHAHHGGKHGTTTTTCQLVHIKSRERRMAWVHLGTVKGLQLALVRHLLTKRHRTRHIRLFVLAGHRSGNAVGHRHHAEVTREHVRVWNAMVWHGVVLVRAVDVDGLDKIVHAVRLVHVLLAQFSQLGLGQFFFEVVVARLVVVVWEMFLHLSVEHALKRVRHLSVAWGEREKNC